MWTYYFNFSSKLIGDMALSRAHWGWWVVAVGRGGPPFCEVPSLWKSILCVLSRWDPLHQCYSVLGGYWPDPSLFFCADLQKMWGLVLHNKPRVPSSHIYQLFGGLTQIFSNGKLEWLNSQGASWALLGESYRFLINCLAILAKEWPSLWVQRCCLPAHNVSGKEIIACQIELHFWGK